jgi:hypothetical protein
MIEQTELIVTKWQYHPPILNIRIVIGSDNTDTSVQLLFIANYL